MFINKVTFIFMYLSTYICTSITFSINVIYSERSERREATLASEL